MINNCGKRVYIDYEEEETQPVPLARPDVMPSATIICVYLTREYSILCRNFQKIQRFCKF